MILGKSGTSICPFNVGDKVEYDHDGRVGFDGVVEDISVIWVLTVKRTTTKGSHTSTHSMVAPESHWRKQDDDTK